MRRPEDAIEQVTWLILVLSHMLQGHNRYLERNLNAFASLIALATVRKLDDMGFTRDVHSALYSATKATVSELGQIAQRQLDKLHSLLSS